MLTVAQKLRRTVKRLPTKHQLRTELRRQTDEYLAHGGKITVVRPGESGYPDRIPRGHKNLSFDGPKKTHTFLPEVVAAIDARKTQKSKPATKKPSRKPRKKIIYDDFGEPVREIWEDE